MLYNKYLVDELFYYDHINEELINLLTNEKVEIEIEIEEEEEDFLYKSEL